MKKKKARKPISLILSIAMLLTLCSGNVMASELSDEEQNSEPEIVQDQEEIVEETYGIPEEAAASEETETSDEPDINEGSAEAETVESTDNLEVTTEEETDLPEDADALEPEEEEEPEISLLADDGDAPTTYEATVVYFDEYNNRISGITEEPIELNVGSVTAALETANQPTKTYEGNTYDIDWVYDANGMKVMETTYIKDSDGNWQLSYSLMESSVGGQTLNDGQQLEIWYTYHDDSLPVNYSPSKQSAGSSLNYVSGAASVNPGETLTFYAYVDREYTYTLSVTAGSTSLPISTTTATSKTESGETVYSTGGEFTVNIPEGTTESIAVTANYTRTDTITFSPGAFADKTNTGVYDNKGDALFYNVNNNGKSDLEDITKENSDDGVDFTFEFETNKEYLCYLEVNGVACAIPPDHMTNNISRTTTIIRDPGGDSSKDCTVTLTIKLIKYDDICTNTITVSNAKEDITITGAEFRSRWDPELMLLADEGVSCKSESVKTDGSTDTSGIGSPINMKDYTTIKYLFGVEDGYKDLTLVFDVMYSYLEYATSYTVDLSKLTSAEELTFDIDHKTHTIATVSPYEDPSGTYKYQITVDPYIWHEADVYYHEIHLTCALEKYNVSYDLNGGSGSITDDTTYTMYRPNINVTTDQPIAPADKVFYGWSTEDPTGKVLSELTILTGGEIIDLSEYLSLADHENPTSGYDGTLTLYAVYGDELPEGTLGTAAVKTYLQDSTGAYTLVADGDQNITITAGQSITVYDSYINENPNVNYDYYTYNKELSNSYLAKTKGSGDEICLYYSLDFAGNVSIDDWQYGDSASDPAAWITVTDASGQKSSQSDSTVGSSYTAGDPVYYIANEDGSKGAQLSGVPTECGSYIVEMTWTQTVSSLDENGQTKTSTVTLTGSKEFKITQREITVKTGDKSKVFDGTALTDSGSDFTVTEGTLVNGDQLTLNYTGSQTAIGHSENKATVDKITDANGNDVTDQYLVTVVPGTLTVTAGTTSVTATKVWDDNKNQDGIRPENVKVQLYADDVAYGDPETLPDAKGNWAHTWDNLDIYPSDATDADDKIVYTVKEVDLPETYTAVVSGDQENGYTITNTHTPETVEITGSKTWEDDDNNDGCRPDSITIRLLANGSPALDSNGNEIIAEVTEADNWSWSFTVPKYANGKEITYSIIEAPIDKTDHYTTSYSSDKLNVTNKHDLDTTTVTVVKTWDDKDNQDGIRSTEVTVQLCDADGNELTDESGQLITLKLNESNQWRDDFTGLQKYDDEKLIEYTVKEVDVTEGYEASVSGSKNSFIITNTHTPETVSISGTKVWDDANDQDGLRPASVTINVLADGKPAIGEDEKPITVTATEAENWAWSVTDLPKYKDEGTEIVYTVTEDQVTGYEEPVITGNMGDGFTITNTHTPETVSISGTKVWDDADNQDGMRPDSVTVNVLADGVLAKDANGNAITVAATAEGTWSWSVADLPKYKDKGTPIVYTVTEDQVTNYEEPVITGDADSGFTITNTHTPETVEIDVTKIWVDSDDQDGIRPESITVNLLADETKVDSVNLTPDMYGDWTWSFTDKPKYRDEGTEIAYTITEDAVEGYNEPDIAGDVEDGFEIYNVHTPETVDISGRKTWDDDNNNDGVRPTSITIRVKADGSPAMDASGNEITAEVTEEEDWSWDFPDLPKYDAGKEITYTITEDAAANYSTDYDSYDVTNSHTPDQTSLTVTAAWDDSKNQDGLRPGSITLKLLADGVDTGQTVVLSADNNWTDTFTGIDMYEDGGKEITYTVEEATVPDGYTVTITGDATQGYTVTNAHIPETIEIDVEKIWDDADDQDGLRPESITVNLLADGKQVDSVNLTEDPFGDWGWNFTDKPKYRDEGTEIVYTLTEEAVEGYNEPDITGDAKDGFEIYNTHTPATIDISGRKTWDDDDNNDGVRPGSITIRVKADGSPALDESGNEITATVTEAEDWSWDFPDLPKYDAGKEISYAITEDAVAHYATSYTGGFSVRNVHTPDQTSLTVNVAWNDSKDQDGIRPASVTLKLLADGEDTGRTVVLSASNNWTATFTGLDMYKDGSEVTYTVEEATVPDGYTVAISGDATTGYTVTDTHTPATIDISGDKTWDDDNNNDGDRPESITIRLLADSRESQNMTVTASDNWSWNFTDLPKYEDGGSEIAYTITEDAVDNYSTTYDGYNVTNTHTPDQTSVTVTKVWNDKNDQDGIRPASVTVKLLADGADTGKTLMLNASNNWQGSFTGLDMYEDQGKTVTYTVEEKDVPDGYTMNITGDPSAGYTITNAHTPETVDISGSKTWDDDNNNDGDRPGSITIRLKADGVDTDSVCVTEGDDWSWNFTDLPKYKAGKEISYTITEDAVDNYATTYDGYNVTNTHTPDQTSLTVSVTFDDQNDQDGIRPESITIILYADGEDTGRTIELSASDNWQGTFTGLDIYEDQGERIQYTVEAEIDGYEVSVDGDATTGYTITFTHEVETIEISGSKTWKDRNNRDGERPDEITIRLLADGEEVGNTTVTPDENGDWNWIFTGYDKYRDGGTEIAYTITEDAVDNYSTTYDGYDVTNSHTPEQTSLTVTKVWKDKDDQDGIRPHSVTVNLLADGEDTGKTLVLNESNGWTDTFTGIDIYEDEGKEIVYTVEEEEKTLPDGYQAAVTGDQTEGYVITNTHEPETVEVSGSKTWDDDDNAYGMRPDSITINLMAGDETVASQTVTEADGWAWSFSGLPKYSAGKEIVYTITEDEVYGYTSEVDGYNVTNKIDPAEFVTGPGPASGNPNGGTGTNGNNPNKTNPTSGTKTGDISGAQMAWMVTLSLIGLLVLIAAALRIKKNRNIK